jgi:hypothetical protein
MNENLFHILFTPDLKGQERVDALAPLISPPCRTIRLDCSSIDFYIAYFQKILDEFPFIQTLTWCKYDEEYELGDGHELYLKVVVNGIDFYFTRSEVDRINPTSYSLRTLGECHYLHPQKFNPDAILFRLKQAGKDSAPDEWLRFLDGFLLFNDLQFLFSKENESKPDLSLFRFEEKRGSDNYWLFNGGYIDDAGEEDEYGYGDEYVQFELKRNGTSFLCTSRVFVPDPPLPPK